MVTTKTMLILANSIKHYPCSCIAGREIQSVSSSTYEIDSWVRPISSHDEGGLSPSESKLQNGRQPKVMDFVELNLTDYANDSLQPENWLINPAVNWRSVNTKFIKPPIDHLVESPHNIWYQPNVQTDRVSSSFLKKSPPEQSIYLIHVPSLTVRFGWRQWDGQFKARRRALFNYNNLKYEMAITDPLFLEHHRSKYPRKGEPTEQFDVTPKNGCYLCISLAPEYNGFHYKVIATVIEP